MALNLNRLNPNQREAVLHAEGPVLVLAGAGSGKTSTMAYRIAHLIADRHVPASAILGLSFTNKAAGELRERVKKLVGETAGKHAAKGLTITTFHSLCARLLRNHSEKLGFQKNFSIVDQGDQRDILKSIFKNLNIDDRKFDHDVILGEIGQAKSRFLKGDAAEAFFLESGRLSSNYGIAAAAGFGHYQSQLKALNSMDFDDLLYYGVELLEKHEDVSAHYNARFRHILVDEYQDTNPSQFRILTGLTRRYQNLCVVGDDDQSIYSWRGADPAHILDFSRHFPSARTITLDQNYRSTTTILDAANAVIANNKHRHDKKLWSDRGQGEPLSEVVLEEDREEGEYVALEICRRAKGLDNPDQAAPPAVPAWKDYAILYRSNSQSRIFEEALRRNGVPYKIVGGMSFLDRKEVKNTLCYWRLILNRKDDASLRRILNWPARGIGKSSLEALSEHAFTQKLTLTEALARAQTLAPRSASGCQALLGQLSSLETELKALPAEPEAVSRWAKASLDRLAIKKAIDEENEDDPAAAFRKWENVEELVHSIGQLKVDADQGELSMQARTGLDLLQEFLNRMTLQAQEDEEDKNELDSDSNQVTLLTLHGAKGLEYPVVFLVGMEEGFLPHKRTIEEASDFSEERRLAYVGITRARDHLIITRAKNRIRYGKPVPRLRSRFMDEVPASMIVQVDKSFPDASSSEEHRKAHEDNVKNHLAAIRAMISGRNSSGAV